MSLEAIIDQRNILEILHFSTNRGLTGALASQDLLSRPLLVESDLLRHVLKFNSSERPEQSIYFDKTEDWIRFVNLSISEINSRFLDVSKSWHKDDADWWCILSFDPQVMTHEGVWFATTNNSYDCCQRGQNVVGFEALFAPRVNRKTKGYNGPWSVSRGTRRAHLPTCEQAEVLYPKRLSLDHLRAVYVEEDDHHDKAVGLLRDFNYSGVEVFVKPEKFGGQGN